MTAKTDEIVRLRAELADVRTARRNVLRNGQSYNAAGSFSTTQATLDQLAAEERRITAAILRLATTGETHAYAAFNGQSQEVD